MTTDVNGVNGHNEISTVGVPQTVVVRLRLGGARGGRVLPGARKIRPPICSWA